MIFDPKNTLYLDANFLVAYLVENNSDYAASRLKMAEFVTNKKTLCLSYLAIDETLKIMKKVIEKAPKAKPKNWCLYYSEFKRAYDVIRETPLCFIVQFENDLHEGILNAIENIKEYDMQPRDAFHKAIMNDLKLESIVSNDGIFRNIKGIKRIAY